MKISKHWLEKFFDAPLPPTPALCDALTFHAFEIDGVEKADTDDVLDVKVTPNRGHDCLCHRGIAKELAAILNLPLTHDPLAEKPALLPHTDAVAVFLKSKLCRRYIAGYITGVSVGPSPRWLRARLEAMGQKSINNVVDATNFVMFNLGQPLHAFDAGRLAQKDGRYVLGVRTAQKGERMEALDGKTYTFSDAMLVIADDHSGAAVGIAGVKGGMPAAIREETKDIIIESANFDGAAVRKAAAALKLRTDASARFEQGISPELAGYGMQAAVELIRKLAGGTLVGFADAYPEPQTQPAVSVSAGQIGRVLGLTLPEQTIEDVFLRLGLPFSKKDGVYTVTPPFERLDLSIAEDLIEEVGRMIGYDRVPEQALPPLPHPPAVNKHFFWADAVRAFLAGQGFSEVYTSVFAERGERVVLNKVDGVRPFLRESLVPGLTAALERNIRNKELLGLWLVKLFEIGTVWKDGKEETVVELAVENSKKEKTASEYRKMLDEELRTLPADPAQYEARPVQGAPRYRPFSRYPYIVRDLALWVPAGADEDSVLDLVRQEAGELLVHSECFDRFEKDGRVSLAFRLVFQSFERTLTESEVNGKMEKISAALRARGFEIR